MRTTVRLAALTYVGRDRTSTSGTRARARYYSELVNGTHYDHLLFFSSSHELYIFFLLFQNGRVSTVCLEYASASAKCFRILSLIKPISLRQSSTHSVHYIRSPSYEFPRAVFPYTWTKSAGLAESSPSSYSPVTLRIHIF